MDSVAVPPIMLIPAPWVALYVVGLAVLNVVYQKLFIRQVQVYLSTTAEQRVEFEKVKTELLGLRAEAKLYEKNSSTFAQHAMVMRKMKPVQTAFENTPPVLRGSAPTFMAKVLSQAPVYLILFFSLVYLRNMTVFAFPAVDGAPEADCIESVFHAMFWPLAEASDKAESLVASHYRFSFDNFSDTVANLTTACLPVRFMLGQSYLALVIFYNCASVSIQFALDIHAKLTTETKSKFF